jgi:hypothetical protein
MIKNSKRKINAKNPRMRIVNVDTLNIPRVINKVNMVATTIVIAIY